MIITLWIIIIRMIIIISITKLILITITTLIIIRIIIKIIMSAIITVMSAVATAAVITMAITTAAMIIGFLGFLGFFGFFGFLIGFLEFRQVFLGFCLMCRSRVPSGGSCKIGKLQKKKINKKKKQGESLDKHNLAHEKISIV